MTNLIYFPAPQTTEQDKIDAGRMRALEIYSNAKTDAERFAALHWVNHWRCLNEMAKVLRQLGLVE